MKQSFKISLELKGPYTSGPLQIDLFCEKFIFQKLQSTAKLSQIFPFRMKTRVSFMCDMRLSRKQSIRFPQFSAANVSTHTGPLVQFGK